MGLIMLARNPAHRVRHATAQELTVHNEKYIPLLKVGMTARRC